MENVIHHYTTIENLALILDSRRIRFSRLDKVDDIKEIDGLPNAFGTYVFISCWTYEKEENIALWKMYTQNLRGVRITLPKDMFKKKLIKAGKYNDFITVESDIISPLSLEEQFTNKYFISNVFNNKSSFYKEVKYENNYPNLYRKNLMADDYGMFIKNIFSFGAYKKEIWKFQNESRFTLYILPLLPLDHSLINGDRHKQFDNLFYVVKNKIPNEIDFFDLELEDSVIDNIFLKLGPLCTESDLIITKSLLDRYTSNGKIETSDLTGILRK